MPVRSAIAFHRDGVARDQQTEHEVATTPIVTVEPIARSTGIDDSASSRNTSSVVGLHTTSACRVRSWSAWSSPAWSKNNA